jgi:peptidoglycan hydrolase CwlO-like protein
MEDLYKILYEKEHDNLMEVLEKLENQQYDSGYTYTQDIQQDSCNYQESQEMIDDLKNKIERISSDLSQSYGVIRDKDTEIMNLRQTIKSLESEIKRLRAHCNLVGDMEKSW